VPGVNRKPALVMVVLTVLVIAFDQLTKSMAVSHLMDRGPYVVTSWLNMNLAFNTGAAFSVLSHAGAWSRYGLSLLAFFVVIGVVFWWWCEASREMLGSVGVALLVGGAVGNLIDRVHYGMVIDFVDVHWKSAHFATFNLADSAICVAVVLLLWRSWVCRCSK